MEQFLNVTRLGGKLGVTSIDTETKQIIRKKVEYEPTLYIRSNRDSKFKTIYGEPVEPKKFDSMSEANKYIKKNKEINVDVYGMEKFQVAYVAETFTSEYDRDNIRTFIIDIENKMTRADGTKIGKVDAIAAEGELTVITIYDSFTNKYYIFGNQIEWNNTSQYKVDVEYESVYCQDEKDLALKVLQFWRMNYPDIITGWNTDGYDIPYIINRFRKVLGESATKKLSPWDTIREREFQDDFGNDVIEYTIVGIASLDYLSVYKKNTFSGRESYSLDYIATYETGEGKLDYRDLGFKDLDDLWERDPMLYITYNIIDVKKVLDIDKKNKFLDIMISVAYYAGVNFDDVFSGMRVWDAVIHKYLLDQNIVTPPNKSAEKETLPGAYVKDVTPGLYKNLMSYDLNSLYPSIIRTLNIGVETIVDTEFPEYNITHHEMVDELKDALIDTSILKEHNLTLASNGYMFKNNKQSFLSKLMEDLYNKRRVYKNRMLEEMSLVEKAKVNGTDSSPHLKLVTEFKNSQMVMKILLNSLYGVIGNTHFRYYNNNMASAITLTGQSIIKWSERKMNEYLNKLLNTNKDYVVLIDTDSIVVDFSGLVDKVFPEYDMEKVTNFLDKVGQQKIEPYLKKIYEELADYINSKDNQMVMARENIASSMLIRKKKAYAMCVQDSEGVRYPLDDPYYKVMGLEIVKSSTPKVVQKDIMDLLKSILAGADIKELREQVDEIRERFNKMSPEDIAFPRSANNFAKWEDSVTIYKKSTPIAVRGALLANYHFNAGVESGNKVKFITLKLPNPINENVISWSDKIEPSLVEYVDYTDLYNKAFFNVAQSLVVAAGMDLEASNTLF